MDLSERCRIPDLGGATHLELRESLIAYMSDCIPKIWSLAEFDESVCPIGESVSHAFKHAHADPAAHCRNNVSFAQYEQSVPSLCDQSALLRFG